jgi:hypothetical protein
VNAKDVVGGGFDDHQQLAGEGDEVGVLPLQGIKEGE